MSKPWSGPRTGMGSTPSVWTDIEHDMIDDDRPATARTGHEQIEPAAREGAFVYGTSFLPGEVFLETVDFYREQTLGG